ncbi:hypothetical protein P0W64_15125 [Tsukamurella sp. 8F]|uniref:hypothetical protein n=1 Tax=unclassified Tsukamurella TaxID=2633480 RepID=UPI0023B9610E|nr:MULTISPECIES: hypothetical protein [unclassified Tsukamurella]MDF0532539.1 hypothetical protein [Tsukamurella sp. 8J]MDF0588109.1 hypothetical protein [Tsukamurella sp. 8F]
MTDHDPVEFCCLLWARPGEEAGLRAYEDAVLALVPEHDGAVLARAAAAGEDDHPHETQVYRFASQAALDGYLADPRRQALTQERDRVIARTELFPVRLLA